MTPTEQAALPAVDEMAKKIAAAARTFNVYTDEYVASQVTPLIAPLYARIADLTQQLSRNQQFVVDQGRAIAERDAVLGECREYVAVAKTDRDRVFSGYIAYPSLRTEARRLLNESIELLNRIDALLGAKGVEDGNAVQS